MSSNFQVCGAATKYRQFVYHVGIDVNSLVMEFQVWLIFQHTVWTINDVLSGYIFCGPSMMKQGGNQW
jgi:hypothetical protein